MKRLVSSLVLSILLIISSGIVQAQEIVGQPEPETEIIIKSQGPLSQETINNKITEDKASPFIIYNGVLKRQQQTIRGVLTLRGDFIWNTTTNGYEFVNWYAETTDHLYTPKWMIKNKQRAAVHFMAPSAFQYLLTLDLSDIPH
ncbi:hypothetical protein CLPU_8c00030 [Gottschalkia purinilytica]|uniref:Uncharacterized protein n=1 Tax=Gottschalkia purinilytica TaxID=1503 RepID=A0A0L0W9K5_GOTPU|nr:hypothetical protein [Gottschalkia purinilytica]KNF08238.1 hypothetical protein CLPU_8c00030 [Gottschalkia purinilytica]